MTKPSSISPTQQGIINECIYAPSISKKEIALIALSIITLLGVYIFLPHVMGAATLYLSVAKLSSVTVSTLLVLRAFKNVLLSPKRRMSNHLVWCHTHVPQSQSAFTPWAPSDPSETEKMKKRLQKVVLDYVKYVDQDGDSELLKGLLPNHLKQEIIPAIKKTLIEIQTREPNKRFLITKILDMCKSHR